MQFFGHFRGKYPAGEVASWASPITRGRYMVGPCFLSFLPGRLRRYAEPEGGGKESNSQNAKDLGMLFTYVWVKETEIWHRRRESAEAFSRPIWDRI